AFGLLGVAGAFQRRPAAGAAAGVIGRFLSHLISGVVFFASYAGNQNVWVYSAIYNGSYLVPELVVSVLVMALLAKAFASRGGAVARG
ncbi:MAG: energy-coupled thiamine transporter ThiT, partial [Actinobacteria bacterium]|nr:energy-coupled thiamine transporter ThiT [Actinomycetota bacterium]